MGLELYIPLDLSRKHTNVQYRDCFCSRRVRESLYYTFGQEYFNTKEKDVKNVHQTHNAQDDDRGAQDSRRDNRKDYQRSWETLF